MFIGQPVLSIVVSGNSALLRLLPVIGPFDTRLAQDKYPLSISASLDAPALATRCGTARNNMRVFQSTSVQATDRMLALFTNNAYVTSELLSVSATKITPNRSDTLPAVSNILSEFGSFEFHTYQERYGTTKESSVHSNRQGASTSGLTSSNSHNGGGSVESPVYQGLREVSLAEHNAWLQRQKEQAKENITYTLRKCYYNDHHNFYSTFLMY